MLFLLMIQIIGIFIAGIMIDTDTASPRHMHHQLFHRKHASGVPQATCPQMSGILIEYLWHPLYQLPGNLTLLTDTGFRQFAPMVLCISSYQLQTIQDTLA